MIQIYGCAGLLQRGRSLMTFVFANDLDYMNEQFAKGTMLCYMFWSLIVIIIISINRNNYANISSARALPGYNLTWKRSEVFRGICIKREKVFFLMSGNCKDGKI